jgi:hypothetical protein
LWPLAAAAVFVQLFISWHIFFPSKPEYILGPAYNVTETVELVTQWYELLREMHYLGKDSIAYPPHIDLHGESVVNVTLARQLGLDERVIETMLAMPYINLLGGSESAPEDKADLDWWPGWMGSDHDILWRSGHFVDYREDADIWQALDPLKRAGRSFARGDMARMTVEKRAVAVPKSALPLSAFRNQRYGLVLLLDVKSNRLLILDTQSGGVSSDMSLKQWEACDRTVWENIIPGRFYGRKDICAARHAPESFRELITKTAKLERGYVPGSIRSDPHYTPELSPPKWEDWVRDLYFEYGWPDRSVVFECQYPVAAPGSPNNGCSLGPFENFNATYFDSRVAFLRHEITVRYMPDWCCPVPRDPKIVDRLHNAYDGGASRICSERRACDTVQSGRLGTSIALYPRLKEILGVSVIFATKPTFGAGPTRPRRLLCSKTW